MSEDELYEALIELRRKYNDALDELEEKKWELNQLKKKYEELHEDYKDNYTYKGINDWEARHDDLR